MIKVIPPTAAAPSCMRMADMKPMDLAMVIGGDNDGHIVLRTANDRYFECMDLSDPGTFFSNGLDEKVRLLPSGTKITIEVE